ncbi:hypothetical protein NLG97_g2410 [Lecanicillium saksenae]|uniref:Uncharacterized protein n=1 Tax=Lecanicillium saksenae TaxID=468837 RepID=A0ACC1R129_9HYPO|nr:hypothetical protein NLG97_g2410 [Lecanicillium saksenae]
MLQNIMIWIIMLTMSASACLTPRDLAPQAPVAHKSGSTPMRPRQQPPATVMLPLGKGDRFQGGKIAPIGLSGNNRDLGSTLNIDEIESGLKGLANVFNDKFTLFTAPYATHENRKVHGAIIGEPRVFLQSGVHARERGGPDIVLYFMSDLLTAQKAGGGLKYGNQTYSNEQVNTALSAGIVFIPMVNPDGVAYDQQTSSCWRKNRNPHNGTIASSIGVDLNRNFDVLWDGDSLFSQNASKQGLGATDPTKETFRGTHPLSEPETKNVDWVMRQHKQLSWLLDLHSDGNEILYAWGDDDPQTTDPSQSFMNKTFDGRRGVLGPEPPTSAYREYIEAADLVSQKFVTNRMALAMNNAGSLQYIAQPSSHLYPTSGSVTDYGGKCGTNRIHGLTIEFGAAEDYSEIQHSPCTFYPNSRRYHQSIRQVGVAFMELLLSAAGEAGGKKELRCR